MVNIMCIYHRSLAVLRNVAVVLVLAQSALGQSNGQGEFHRNYDETNARRNVLAKAVASVNSILGNDAKFVLATSWTKRLDTRREIIPVYLGDPIAPWQPARMAFVPDKERCIIVEDREIATLENIWGDMRYKDLKRHIDIDKLLAIVLLHESAHLFFGHNGCLDQSSDRQSARIRQSIEFQQEEGHKKNRLTGQKQLENEADSFVVKALQNAKTDNQIFIRSWEVIQIGKRSRPSL